MSRHTPSLESIYRENFQFVWRVLRRLGVPEQEARDAVQDVFVVVHRKLPEFRGDAKVTTWLFSICMRIASERRRTRRHKVEVITDTPPHGQGDLTEDLEQREALMTLERILDEMPLEQRAVLTLFELEGQRCEEIAELLQIPVGTVYSRLRLARAALRRGAARRNAKDQFAMRLAGAAV